MKKVIVCILFFAIYFLTYSQKVDENTALKVAQNILMKDKPDLINQVIEKTIPIGLHNDTLYFVFTYPDDGFAIVSAESSAPPVLGHCKWQIRT